MSPLTIKIFDATQLPVVASQPAAPPLPDPVKALAADLRRAMAQHDACCSDARCLYRANLLAYVAHAMQATRADLQRLPSYLFAYDLRCGEEGRCDFHRECAAAASAAPAATPVAANEMTSMSPTMLFRLSGWTFVAALARLAARNGWPRLGGFLYPRAISGLSKLSMRLR